MAICFCGLIPHTKTMSEIPVNCVTDNVESDENWAYLKMQAKLLPLLNSQSNINNFLAWSWYP